MSKILVTGARGFIGSALVQKLNAQGYKTLSVSSADGDIAEVETLTKFSQEKIFHVIHLAAKTFVPDSLVNPQIFYKTNVLGTANVLEFCRANRIPLTYVSAYIYGHCKSLPISENETVQPSNPYAMTKWLAEQICAFYAKNYNLPITTIRPFNVYGIGQDQNFLIPKVISQVIDDSNQILVNDLVPKRDYIFLEDLITALIATLKKSDGYNVYNIGSGTSISVKEVIDIVQDLAGTKKNVFCVRMARINELKNVVADITKAKSNFGWYPKYTFREGINIILKSELNRRKNDISLCAN